MITHRISEQLRQQNWVSVLIELFVVVIGILLALWVDQWRDDVRNRTIERQYLQDMLLDLQVDRRVLDRSITQRQQRLPAIREIVELLSEPVTSQQDAARLLTLEREALYGSVAFYVPASNTFDKMQSAGELQVVRDDGLYRAVTDYYTLSATRMGTFNGVEAWLEPWRQISLRLYGAMHFVQITDETGTNRLLEGKYTPSDERTIVPRFDVESRKQDVEYLSYLGDMYQQQGYFEVRWTELLADNLELQNQIRSYLM